MKKMMIALAGIAAVMMLASCQKEVEIDGDVSLEQSTTYDYRLKVNGTVTKSVYKRGLVKDIYGKEHGLGWNYVQDDKNESSAKDWQGNVTWENNPNSKSNVKEYALTITDDRKEFPTELTIEYYDKKYRVAGNNYSSYGAFEGGVIDTSPEKSTFELRVIYSTRDDERDYDIGDTYTQYSYDLTFTR